MSYPDMTSQSRWILCLGTWAHSLKNKEKNVLLLYYYLQRQDMLKWDQHAQTRYKKNHNLVAFDGANYNNNIAFIKSNLWADKATDMAVGNYWHIMTQSLFLGCFKLPLHLFYQICRIVQWMQRMKSLIIIMLPSLPSGKHQNHIALPNYFAAIWIFLKPLSKHFSKVDTPEGSDPTYQYNSNSKKIWDTPHASWSLFISHLFTKKVWNTTTTSHFHVNSSWLPECNFCHFWLVFQLAPMPFVCRYNHFLSPNIWLG